MPPEALISLMANSTPFLNTVPAVVPGPDSSTMLAILMSWAWARPATARAAQAARVLRVAFMEVSLVGGVDWISPGVGKKQLFPGVSSGCRQCRWLWNRPCGF